MIYTLMKRQGIFSVSNGLSRKIYVFCLANDNDSNEEQEVEDEEKEEEESTNLSTDPNRPSLKVVYFIERNTVITVMFRQYLHD